MKHTGKLLNVLCITLAITICLLMAAGCAARSSSETSAASTAAVAPSYNSKVINGAADMAAPQSPEATATAQAAGAEKGGIAAPKDEASLEKEAQATAGSSLNRKIIKTVNIVIETQEFDKLISSLQENTQKFGGFVESSSVSGLGINQKLDEPNAPGRNGYITVRIPTDKLSEFTALVGTLGNVTQKDENSQDITLTYADTEARKKALQVEYERLMALLEKAESLDSVVALESRLSEVRYQLDNYSSELRRYDSLVDFSTVTVNINEVKRFTPQQSEKQGIGERITIGLQETWLDIRDGAGDFLVWFVVDLPYILIFAAFVVLVIFLIRRGIKKSRAKQAAAPRYPLYPQAPQGFVPPVQNPSGPEHKDENK